MFPFDDVIMLTPRYPVVCGDDTELAWYPNNHTIIIMGGLLPAMQQIIRHYNESLTHKSVITQLKSSNISMA